MCFSRYQHDFRSISSLITTYQNFDSPFLFALAIHPQVAESNNSDTCKVQM